MLSYRDTKIEDEFVYHRKPRPTFFLPTPFYQSPDLVECLLLARIGRKSRKIRTFDSNQGRGRAMLHRSCLGPTAYPMLKRSLFQLLHSTPPSELLPTSHRRRPQLSQKYGRLRSSSEPWFSCKIDWSNRSLSELHRLPSVGSNLGPCRPQNAAVHAFIGPTPGLAPQPRHRDKND